MQSEFYGCIKTYCLLKYSPSEAEKIIMRICKDYCHNVINGVDHWSLTEKKSS